MARQPGSTGNSPARLLHASLTDVPVGAIVIAAVLDVFSASEGVGHPVARETYRAGTFVLMIGTGVLFLAVAAGLADRARHSARGSRARRRIDIHASVMTGLGILAIIDLAVRRNHYADAGSSPGIVVALTLSCLAVTVVGGTLGGALAHRGGLGVPGHRTSRSDSAANTSATPASNGTAPQ